MLSIVIPTYRREQVLIDTVAALLRQVSGDDEILLMDQTAKHAPGAETQLAAWERGGTVRRHRLPVPGTPGALNRGLLLARHDLVLFLDDDIVPGESLLASHAAAHRAHPETWCVAGQVLQPGESPADVAFQPSVSGLRAFEAFPFYSRQAMPVGNAMAGNLSVRRGRALSVGGFDESFLPPVSYRFETEFARRILGAGGTIWFEPSASIRHLRAAEGGTRTAGGHLRSASPVHGVGDYYYALRCGHGWDRIRYLARRPFREVLTGFHLRHPWFIPVKLTGEIRAFRLALQLARRGPRLLDARAAERSGA